METPKSIEDVEFSRKSRGYDPEQVDRFVSSVRGELSDLQDKLRRLEASSGRGSAGGSRREGGKLHDPDRAVERMLAAAQQTADRVVFDAEAEADRLVSEAEVEAERLVGDAQSQSRHRMAEVEAQGEKIRREAVTEARRVVEETRQPLAREVRKLRSTRDGLRSEIEMLKRFLNDHRGRVRAIGDSLRSMADDPAALRVAKVDEPTAIDVDVSDDFEIEIPSAPTSSTKPAAAPAPAPVAAKAAATPTRTAPAAAAAVVVDDDSIDDDLDVEAPEVEWGSNYDDADSTGAAVASSGGIDAADDAPDFDLVGDTDADDRSFVDQLENDDVAGSSDDGAGGDDGDDDNVISGAFASVIGGGESEEPTSDRFRDALAAAKDDADDALPSGSGFFESQIDDPS